MKFWFNCRLCREISFQFRTRLPHGLLVYHNVKNPEGINLDPYALYVIVEKGQLKVVHVFGKHSTSVTVGEALNRDEWHSVMVSPTTSFAVVVVSFRLLMNFICFSIDFRFVLMSMELV